MLREQRKQRKVFEKRNLKRWKKGFDLLETLYAASTEIGGEFSAQNRE
jgi:hypothetical protein|tara:strand:- start:754 stop:897 length:144 start_codon:yes stop_codon:yes gene_type:complete